MFVALVYTDERQKVNVIKPASPLTWFMGIPQHPCHEVMPRASINQPKTNNNMNQPLTISQPFNSPSSIECRLRHPQRCYLWRCDSGGAWWAVPANRKSLGTFPDHWIRWTTGQMNIRDVHCTSGVNFGYFLFCSELCGFSQTSQGLMFMCGKPWGNSWRFNIIWTTAAGSELSFGLVDSAWEAQGGNDSWWTLIYSLGWGVFFEFWALVLVYMKIYGYGNLPQSTSPHDDDHHQPLYIFLSSTSHDHQPLYSYIPYIPYLPYWLELLSL